MNSNRITLAEEVSSSVSHLTTIDYQSMETIDSLLSFKELLEIIERLIEPKYLNKIQILVLKYTCQGLSYSEISKLSNYDVGYVKDTGSTIWKMLSDSLGVKVTKYNVQIILRQYIRRLEKGISVDWHNLFYKSS